MTEPNRVVAVVTRNGMVVQVAEDIETAEEWASFQDDHDEYEVEEWAILPAEGHNDHVGS